MYIHKTKPNFTEHIIKKKSLLQKKKKSSYKSHNKI